MTTQRWNDVKYVSVEEQAREDMGKVLGVFGMTLRFLTPVIIATVTIICGHHCGDMCVQALASIAALTLMSHLGLAVVRFFGRNEEGVWKSAFGSAWGTWAKWTVWPMLCGTVACSLMLIDIGAGATLNNTLMDSLGYIRGIVS